MIEFLVLSILWSVFLRYGLKDKSQIYKIVLTILICLIVAFIDETLQIFSAGRTARVKDVFIDMIGVVIGRIALYKV